MHIYDLMYNSQIKNRMSPIRIFSQFGDLMSSPEKDSISLLGMLVQVSKSPDGFKDLNLMSNFFSTEDVEQKILHVARAQSFAQVPESLVWYNPGVKIQDQFDVTFLHRAPENRLVPLVVDATPVFMDKRLSFEKAFSLTEPQLELFGRLLGVAQKPGEVVACALRDGDAQVYQELAILGLVQTYKIEKTKVWFTCPYYGDGEEKELCPIRVKPVDFFRQGKWRTAEKAKEKPVKVDSPVVIF